MRGVKNNHSLGNGGLYQSYEGFIDPTDRTERVPIILLKMQLFDRINVE